MQPEAGAAWCPLGAWVIIDGWWSVHTLNSPCTLLNNDRQHSAQVSLSFSFIVAVGLNQRKNYYMTTVRSRAFS